LTKNSWLIVFFWDFVGIPDNLARVTVTLSNGSSRDVVESNLSRAFVTMDFNQVGKAWIHDDGVDLTKPREDTLPIVEDHALSNITGSTHARDVDLTN